MAGRGSFILPDCGSGTVMFKLNHWWRSIAALVCIVGLHFGAPSLATESSMALVDIQSIAPDIQLDMRYATSNNFLKQAVYPHATCLLRSATATRLAKVQAALAAVDRGLKIFDCYRPLSVQRQMWAILPDAKYVANPKTGSRHNRGAAVDVSLVDAAGKPLAMPSEFDDFSDRASANGQNGSSTAKHNRQQLQTAMKQQGFTGINSEWWHFDDPDWRRYELLDQAFPIAP
jgi:zinc D-Ala-D-Ala dipeptidase